MNAWGARNIVFTAWDSQAPPPDLGGRLAPAGHRRGPLDLADGVFEGGSKPKADEAFDADASIATGELGRLIPDLIDALGGEHQPGVPALAA